MEKKIRNSNIELLRIITMFGVILLHYNGMVAFAAVQEGSVNQYILLFLESVCIGAVNLFILITGFFLSKSNERKLSRAVELLVLVMLTGMVKYLLGAGLEDFHLRSLAGSAVPRNHFITMYVTLYLISPGLNRMTQGLSRKQYGTMVLIAFLLFNVIPSGLDLVRESTGKFLSDMYPIGTGGSQYGYNIINFIMMYLLGGYLRSLSEEEKLPGAGKSALLLVGCIAGVFFLQQPWPLFGRAYCNPFVVGIAVGWFCLFIRLRIQSKTINLIARSTLMCFMLHDYLLPIAGIPQAVQGHWTGMLLHILLTVIAIYGISWVVWRIYDWISVPFWRWLNQKWQKADQFLSL